MTDSHVDNSPRANGPSTKKGDEEEKDSGNNDGKKTTTKSHQHSTKGTNGKLDDTDNNTNTDTNGNTEDDTLLIMDLEAISAMYTRVPMEDIDETDEITDVSIPLAQILRNRHTIYHIHLVNCNNRKSFSEWVG
ncbi:hypothetical protein RFI_19886 [Reticulomyxa filosa]|uniref:Uncharacterized protein n=1 Tax=Reticulomyxa filosa TaxID=46433 RepID=X6MVH2_RETFI|nr:hypothetical protein RFI_19886 [Reticulomyxa filosa]|eukprot:ETO17437.1 hypothetical protein RFI_19886 [Reticulomyxa filosa]